MKVLKGADGVAEAVRILESGECVGLPTETVYGLAAIADQDDAVRKIYAAKSRPPGHPLIVHLPSIDHLDYWAADIPAAAYRLAEHFWPGPLTFLLKKNSERSDVVTGGLETVAVRVPSHPVFLEVLRELDKALAAPSANPYKQLSPTTADQVVTGLTGKIPAVLDAGPSEFGLESTILDLISEKPAILRSGPIGREALEAVLGESISMPEQHDVAVPGNVEAHYQPRTPMRCVNKSELERFDVESTGFVVCSEQSAEKLASEVSVVRNLSDNPVDYGRLLYQTLADLDAMDLKQLIVEVPPQTEEWAAVNDRLKRAAGG